MQEINKMYVIEPDDRILVLHNVHTVMETDTTLFVNELYRENMGHHRAHNTIEATKAQKLAFEHLKKGSGVVVGECRSCGHIFELKRKRLNIIDRFVIGKECPKCKSDHISGNKNRGYYI